MLPLAAVAQMGDTLSSGRRYGTQPQPVFHVGPDYPDYRAAIAVCANLRAERTCDAVPRPANAGYAARQREQNALPDCRLGTRRQKTNFASPLARLFADFDRLGAGAA